MRTRQEIREIAMRQCAVDFSCTAEDLDGEENVIVESVPADTASRFLTLPFLCGLASWGGNVVAACRADLIPEVSAYVNGQEKHYRCFETPQIYDLNKVLEQAGGRVAWTHTYYLPDPEAVFAAELPCGYATRELHPEDFGELYTPEWSNALCADRKELDVLGVGAYDGGKLVGLAACSADCPEMWQIGIDVLPEYRRQGIASALTNRLARAIFDHGKIPFYAAAWSNVRSVKNGIKTGFRPAWVALTCRAEEK